MVAEEIEVYRALDCKTRVDVLGQLYTGPKDLREIAAALSIGPFTARYHLEALEEGGLVSKSEGRGGRGRPRVLYRLGGSPVLLTIPRRQYLALGVGIISTLESMLGQEGSREVMRRTGYQEGKRLLGESATKHQVGAWTVDSFRRYFLDGALSELAGKPETVDGRRAGRLVCRVYNCPVEELARQFPEHVCEALENGFREGLVESSQGRLCIERTKSMQGGDPCCEFEVGTV